MAPLIVLLAILGLCAAHETDGTASSQRVKLTYGPYTIPPRSIDDGMKGFVERGASMPCSDCYITSLRAAVEYPNGTAVTASDGIWLHHTVATNYLTVDSVCPGEGAGDTGERFFASGNEKLPVDFTRGAEQRLGYYLDAEPKVVLFTELMNMNDHEDTAMLTITYDFVPGADAKDFRPIRTLWLDVGGCEGSGMPVNSSMGTEFDFTSQPFTVTEPAHILFSGGHLHNGGTHVEIMKNGQLLCDAVAEYTDHDISSMSSCVKFTEDQASLKPGDQLSIRAYYDTDAHSLMKNTDGSFEDVMGISLVYVTPVKQGSLSHVTQLGTVKVALVFIALAAATVMFILIASAKGRSLKDAYWTRKSGLVRGRDNVEVGSLLGQERYQDQEED